MPPDAPDRKKWSVEARLPTIVWKITVLAVMAGSLPGRRRQEAAG
jgi:hypothetical protein